MRSAYSYVRFSTKRQARGDSLRRQLAATRAYCVQKGLALDEGLCYQDLGISAFKGRNGDVGALAALREAVQIGRVPPGAVIVVESLDRLSRDEISEALRLWLELLGAGVDIHTLTPLEEYTAGSVNDLPRLLGALIVMQRAHEDSATRSARLRAMWDAKRKAAPKPATSICPAWLKLKADRSGYEVIREKAAAVLRIYLLARDGHGTIQITRRLTAEGFAPIGRFKDYWSRAYVQEILENRAVMGEWQPRVHREGKRIPQGEPIKGYFPALLSEKEWYATRQAIEARCMERGPRAEGLRNLFTGILHDARDGGTMYLKRYPSQKTQDYLIPSGPANGEEQRSQLSFPYQRFEDVFLSVLNHELTAELLQQGPANRQLEIDAKVARVAAVKRARKEAERRVIDDPENPGLIDLVQELGEQERAELADLDALRRQQSNGHAETLAEARHIRTLLLECPREELTDLRTRLKARIRSLVKEVWVLIEGTNRQNKWATAQVFFHKGDVLRYTFPKLPPVGFSAIMGRRGVSLDVDLRQWRHRPTAERPSFPCPRGAVLMAAGRELLDRARRGQL
jgi:DNA invertase Pin-like site-specific DNA recombinase